MSKTISRFACCWAEVSGEHEAWCPVPAVESAQEISPGDLAAAAVSLSREYRRDCSPGRAWNVALERVVALGERLSRDPACVTAATGETLRAMLMMRGLVSGVLEGQEVGAARSVLQVYDRALSALIPASARHDRGAYARCSCGRYSVDPGALDPGRSVLVCDCGESAGWCGSFEAPGEGAVFALGRRAPRAEVARR